MIILRPAVPKPKDTCQHSHERKWPWGIFSDIVSCQCLGKVVKVPALFLLFFPTLFLLLTTAHATNCFDLGLPLFSQQVAETEYSSLKYISFLSSLSRVENLYFPLYCVSQTFFFFYTVINAWEILLRRRKIYLVHGFRGLDPLWQGRYVCCSKAAHTTATVKQTLMPVLVDFLF